VECFTTVVWCGGGSSSSGNNIFLIDNSSAVSLNNNNCLLLFNFKVIETGKDLELELHPIIVLLYRHQPVNATNSKPTVQSTATPWAGMAGAYGAAALSSTMSYVQNHNLMLPKRFAF
jgi:hypothetical protein